jgi:hypothetical protein
MAKATSKGRARRVKTKPPRATALRSTSASVRKKGSDRDPASLLSGDAAPAMEMLRSLTGIMNAYIELPARLMQCRTPLDVWREQALFAKRLFDLTSARGSPLQHSRNVKRKSQ